MEVGGHVDYSQVLAVEKVLRQVAAHVKTGALAREVDRRLGIGMDPESLLGKIRTQVLAGSLILQIDVEDSDPARAEKLAAAVAQVVQERQEEAAAEAPDTARVTAAVLDRPSPAQFVWPQTRSIVGASALAGAIAGIVLAFILYYLDDTIPSPEEAERWLGLPLLGLIPVENA
jgi:capsular polysaccharide biosynthesis protein